MLTPLYRGEQVALMPEHAPHLYAYYALASGVGTVRADMSVFSKGKLVHQASADRPVKGDPAQQRVGLRLDPGLVSGKAEFKIVLTTPQGERAECAVHLDIL